MSRRYESPEAFKQALETRVRRAARERSVDMGRFRQLLLFDRFLARVFEELPDRAMCPRTKLQWVPIRGALRQQVSGPHVLMRDDGPRYAGTRLLCR
jgi:hypothetical protein